MTSVFIGGSRAVSRLNETIRVQLDDLIQKGCTIFIGDANGADRMAQQHFADRGYSNVVVFCMDGCRNNVGNWQIRTIPHSSSKKDFSYFAKKDLAMAREARCGVMFWDGKSKGTLNNIHNLLHEQNERDRRDASRGVGPLAQAPDAVYVSTDGLTRVQVVDELEALIRHRLHEQAN